MSSVVGEKFFDVMKWLRATRGQICEETQDMSFEETREWRARRTKRAVPEVSGGDATHGE